MIGGFRAARAILTMYGVDGVVCVYQIVLGFTSNGALATVMFSSFVSFLVDKSNYSGLPILMSLCPSVLGNLPTYV